MSRLTRSSSNSGPGRSSRFSHIRDTMPSFDQVLRACPQHVLTHLLVSRSMYTTSIRTALYDIPAGFELHSLPGQGVQHLYTDGSCNKAGRPGFTLAEWRVCNGGRNLPQFWQPFNGSARPGAVHTSGLADTSLRPLQLVLLAPLLRESFAQFELLCGLSARSLTLGSIFAMGSTEPKQGLLFHVMGW